MGAKITFDATNRKFVVTEPPDVNGVITIDLNVDLYSDGKEDWQDDTSYPDLQGMQFPVDAIGGQSFGTETLGVSYLIKHGWSFKPYEADHTLIIDGNIGTEGGWELVDDTVGQYRVRVENKVSALVALVNAGAFEIGAFLGAVTVDPTNGVGGTSFPTGTRSTPVNNLSDAEEIARTRGLNTLLFTESMTIDGSANLAGFRLISDNPNVVTLTILDAAVVDDAYFENLTVEGIIDQNSKFINCTVLDIDYFNGLLDRCGLAGTITVRSGDAKIWDCYSTFAGGGMGQHPDIYMSGFGNSLQLRHYTGGIGLYDYTGGGDISMDFASGRAVIDSTVTGGDVVIRGDCTIEDMSTANVIDQTVNSDARITRKVVYNRQEFEDDGSDVWMVTYEDDGVTEFSRSIVTQSDNSKPDVSEGVAKRGNPT